MPSDLCHYSTVISCVDMITGSPYYIVWGGVIVKLPLAKMRTFEYVCFEFATSSKQPGVLFCQNGDKITFKMCFFFTFILKTVNYDLIIIIRFCH